MSEVVGEAVLKIRTDDSGVDSGIKDAGAKAGKGYSSGFAGSLKGLAALAGGALVAGKVLGFTKQAIQGASDLNETVAKTGVIFGRGQKAVLDFASQGAAALGQTKQQALDAAATFGVFGKAAGLSGGDLAGFSTQFTSLATDLASFHNSSPEEAITAIGAALRGESEPIRRFGVLLDDASLRAEAMRQGLIKTTKEALTPQQKTLAASALIMKQTSDAQGDFQRTSGGLANQQRILSASLEDLSTKLGSALLPVVTKVVTFINTAVVPALSNIGPMFSRVGETISSAFGSGGALNGVATTISQFAKGLGLAWDVLRSGDDVASGLGETLDFALGNTGRFVAPIRDAVMTIQDLISGMVDAVQQVLPVMAETFTTKVLPAIKGLANYIVTNVVPIFVQWARMIVTQVIPTLVQIATFIYGTVYPAVIAIVVAVAQQLKPVFDTLVQVLRDDVVPTISNLVQTFREDLLPVLQPIIEKLLAVAGFLLKLAAVILRVVLPPLLKLAGFLIRNIVPAVVAVIVIIAKVVNGILNFGRTLIRGGVQVMQFAANLNRMAREGVANVVSAITALPGKVIAFVGRMVTAGKKLIGGLLDGIRSAATGVGGVVASIAASVRDAIVGIINSMIDLINNAIPDSISVPAAPDIDLPNTPIPHLQSGSRSFGGGWADVGEVGPERVFIPRGSRVLTAAQTAQASGLDVQALAAAIAAALGPVLTRPNLTLMVPTADPQAAAMAVMNRLAVD